MWCLTPGGKSESIRFYDTEAIDKSGRYLAVTRYLSDDRLPSAGDKALVVVRDLQTGCDIIIEETTAWDTQLGAQPQWHPHRPEVFFNVMDGNDMPHAVSIDLNSGLRQSYPWTVYMLSPCGCFTVSPDLRKIGRSQAGYGVIVEDPEKFQNQGAAIDDGVYITDLEANEVRLAAPVETLVSRSGISRNDAGDFHTFHVKWSPKRDRLMVVLRWLSREGEAPRRWVLTCDPDGQNVHCLVSASLWEQGGHHPNWYPDGRRVIMNLRPDPAGPLRFCEITDENQPRITPVTDLPGSGHPSIHPSGQWLLADAYLRENLAPKGCSPLRLVNLHSGGEACIATVPAEPAFAGPKLEWRVDLHPAWCADGQHIVFNGWWENRRAVFLADLQPLMTPSFGARHDFRGNPQSDA